MLVDFPGNDGKIFSIDPSHVTAVKPYRSTLPGRGAQLFDMTSVWMDNHAIFVCSWSIDHVRQVIDDAQDSLKAAFEAGYRAGIERYDDPQPFATWMKEKQR